MRSRRGSMDLKKMNRNCENVAELLKVIAHTGRLLILCHLVEGEKTVGELSSLCELSQSNTSQFLNRMKREGILSASKEGGFTSYSISDPKMIKLIKSLHNIFNN
jgi:ArsR family transcriptional regulator, virulence genes transcriptional regulator